MNPLAKTLLSCVSWDEFHADHSTAAFVPDAIQHLADSKDADAAEAAYWELDNRIVVQGAVFDSALAVVPVLLALLAGDLGCDARARVLDLLFEIQEGEAHEDETSRERNDLGLKCTQAVADGMWLYLGCLLDVSSMVRKSAVDLIGQLEDRNGRRELILDFIAESDSDHEVRQAASWWLRK